MPCYQINTISLNFEAGHLGLLQKAAHVLGLIVVDDGLGRVLRDQRGAEEAGHVMVQRRAQGHAETGRHQVLPV